MPKFRPIEREFYSDDIAAGYELAVHARVGFKPGPTRTVRSMSVPAVSGARIRSALGGGKSIPANSPQSTATGGNQNPPFGSGN